MTDSTLTDIPPRVLYILKERIEQYYLGHSPSDLKINEQLQQLLFDYCGITLKYEDMESLIYQLSLHVK